MKNINSWEDFNKEYPEDFWLNDVSIEQAREYVNHCFDLYEKEGFAKEYWTPYEDKSLTQHIGKSFKMIKRMGEPEYDLEALPAWLIKFEDGEEIEAYPEEIISSQMIANGCKAASLYELN
jgi:hypothetical protein